MRETRLGTQALRFQRLDLPQRLIEVFLRRLHRRLLLMQLGRKLLGILNGAPAVLRQFLVAFGLLLCKYERSAPQPQLRLAGIDLRLLNVHLSVDVLHVRLRLLHRTLGLADRDPEVGGINDQQ